jgi:hypothetical protein
MSELESRVFTTSPSESVSLAQGNLIRVHWIVYTCISRTRMVAREGLSTVYVSAFVLRYWHDCTLTGTSARQLRWCRAPFSSQLGCSLPGGQHRTIHSGLVQISHVFCFVHPSAGLIQCAGYRVGWRGHDPHLPVDTDLRNRRIHATCGLWFVLSFLCPAIRGLTTGQRSRRYRSCAPWLGSVFRFSRRRCTRHSGSARATRFLQSLPLSSDVLRK